MASRPIVLARAFQSDIYCDAYNRAAHLSKKRLHRHTFYGATRNPQNSCLLIWSHLGAEDGADRGISRGKNCLWIIESGAEGVLRRFCVRLMVLAGSGGIGA
jgi:hypothetical protein